MKKIYFLLLFALIAMAGSAQEVVFDFSSMGFSSGEKLSTVTSDDGNVVITFEKGSNDNVSPVYNSGDPSVRVYGGNIMTVSAVNGGSISKIEMTLSGKSITASAGTYADMVWTGSETSVSFTTESGSGHTKYFSLTVTIGGGSEPTKVSSPLFSLDEGTYMAAQTVELSCSTEGASIYYAVNDEPEQVYSAPIELSENGTYSIKAWGVKEGMENSDEVIKNYVIDIFDGTIEDFDFVTIGQSNSYPTDDNSPEGGTPEFTSGDVTVSTTQTGNTPNRFWKNWAEYRMYSGSTLTFSVPAGYVIVRIDFTPNSSNISGEGYEDGIWTGEQQIVTLDIVKNVTFTDFVVYYKQLALDQVIAPVFSLSSGTYEGSQSVELSCATEGAAIHYVVNDGEEQTYTEAIELSEVGTYSIKAWATKDGMTNSSEVTANYEILAPLVANSIAEFLQLGAENADRFITLNCGLTVTFQGGGEGTRDLYVKDAAGEGLLIYDFNNPSLNVGDVIPAGLKGKYKNYNDLLELVNPENFGEVTETVQVTPEEKTAATVAAADLSKLVVINNATLSEMVEGNGTLTDESGSITLFDKGYMTEYPSDLSKKYNVTAVVSIYKGTVQLYPVSVEQVLEQVAAPSFSLEGGEYEGDQELTLSCETEGATILYTINGGEEQTYTEAIQLTTGEYTIVAWATKEGMTDSETVTAEYVITELVGVDSVNMNKAAVYATEGGISVTVLSETAVGVYNTVGQLVKSVVVAEGETTVSLASGLYIVKAGERAVKVIVK